MHISVIGCGRWGSFISWYLDRIDHQVTLYGRPGSKRLEAFMATRQNALLTLPESIHLTSDLESAIQSEIIVISINAQGLRGLMATLETYDLRNKTLVLCMKGIEIASGMRLTEIVASYVGDQCGIAVWLGPGHVQSFYKGVPNCMVIDSEDQAVKIRLVEAFSSDLIRFYYGEDLIGNEIGGATKNVIGIAAGMLDGLGLSSLKGALMSRGTREVARLIKALGGKELSAYGLCHLGDYEATVFSPYSHNRHFGEAYVKEEAFEALAEGYYTTKAIVALADKLGVDMPITQAVYKVLYEQKDPKEALESLFLRSLKKEF